MSSLVLQLPYPSYKHLYNLSINLFCFYYSQSLACSIKFISRLSCLTTVTAFPGSLSTFLTTPGSYHTRFLVGLPFLLFQNFPFLASFFFLYIFSPNSELWFWFSSLYQIHNSGIDLTLYLPAIHHLHLEVILPIQPQYDLSHASPASLKTICLFFIPDLYYPVIQNGKLNKGSLFYFHYIGHSFFSIRYDNLLQKTAFFSRHVSYGALPALVTGVVTWPIQSQYA